MIAENTKKYIRKHSTASIINQNRKTGLINFVILIKDFLRHVCHLFFLAGYTTRDMQLPIDPLKVKTEAAYGKKPPCTSSANAHFHGYVRVHSPCPHPMGDLMHGTFLMHGTCVSAVLIDENNSMHQGSFLQPKIAAKKR